MHQFRVFQQTMLWFLLEMQDRFPTTAVKLQSIMKFTHSNWHLKSPSPPEGSQSQTSSVFHNANKLNPNPCIYDRIVSATAAGSGNNSFSDSLKTELDSHASLWCLGGTHSFLRRLGSWICPKRTSVAAMKCCSNEMLQQWNVLIHRPK